MLRPAPGERLALGDGDVLDVVLESRGRDRLALAAIDRAGRVTAFDRTSDGWRFDASAPADHPVELVLYVVDDRQGGFADEGYPLVLTTGGVARELPAPSEKLAAVILGELYLRDGARRMKVSNEGFVFGIDAYARARSIDPSRFPGRTRSPSARGERAGDGPPPSGRPAPGAALGSGSGVIVAPGFVVTNAHVIRDGSAFHVGPSNVELHPVAVDPQHDLALLQGPVSGQPIELRVGSPVWLGESVMAAGYPLKGLLGADLKVSTGNVSGMTGWHGDVSCFQFTAPIGSGSSGGAIVDEEGRLVGVATSSLAHDDIRSQGAISENVNFGVKATLVHEMLAAAGIDGVVGGPAAAHRRDVVQRLQRSVVSVNVVG